MNGSLKGKILAKLETRAHAVKIAELEALLGTPNAAKTARLNPFFGPTVIGESQFVKTLELNLDRALLGGHEITFQRAFVPDEPVHVEMILADFSEKNGMQFGIIETRFVTPYGEEIQVQTTTFIERMLA